MPAEFTFFVEDDFDEHYNEIFAMCEEALDVKLKELVFERTPAPLGEGENFLFACVASATPVTSITNEKVHLLDTKLQERFGLLSFQLRSVCPTCEKNSYDHYGYFSDTPHTSLNMCDKCSTKAYSKKERRKKVKCPTCSKKFVAEDHGEGYTLYMNFRICNELTRKNVADTEHKCGSMFDTTRFCSKRCVQAKLDEIVEELAATSKQLTEDDNDES